MGHPLPPQLPGYGGARGERELPVAVSSNASAGFTRISAAESAGASTIARTEDLQQRLAELPASGRTAIHRLSEYDLSMPTLFELADGARFRRFHRDEKVLLGSRAGMVHFLLTGCAAERTRDEQVVRLWRNGTVFGDQEVMRTIVRLDVGHRSTYLRFLSDSRTLAIPRDTLRHLALRDTSVALMLGRIAMERAHTVERLYTATQKSPRARVAALLDYLAGENAVLRPKTIENKERKMVVTGVKHPIVEGPTQLDIAEALAMGRATVERAVKRLRAEGALAEFPSGDRSNRTYEIVDRDLLQDVARGA